MTCVSNPRPGSNTIAGVLLLLVLTLVAAPGTQCQALKPSPPILVLAKKHEANMAQLEFLEADRVWISGLAPSSWRIPVLPDTGAVITVDSLESVRKWILANAPADTIPMVRPLSSRLRQRWHERGYLLTRVDSAGTDSLVVHPGIECRLAELTIEGPNFSGRDHLLQAWLPQTDDLYSSEDMNQALERVLLGVGELGYPFARWVTRQVELDSSSGNVRIQATLLPGHRARIGRVSSDLPPGRAADFLAEASGLQPGELFRHSDMQRAIDRLLARDLYARIDEPSVYVTTSVDTVGIHFPVTPRRKVNRLQFVLGLSRKTEEQGTRLSGEVDLSLPNLAGTGRALQLGWNDNGDDKSRFGFSFLEPLAFGTPLDMDVAVDHEVQEESYTRFRLENSWRLPVIALWGLELGVGWDRSTYPSGTLESSRRTRVRAGFLHRRGDRTRSGWAGQFSIENAWRSSRARTGDPVPEGNSGLAQSVSQRIYEVDLSGELWLARTWSLASLVAFRQVDTDDDEVPLSEQFRFGGANTLRGYREDEFHGVQASWGGIELRAGRPGGSRLYTFLDLGYFRYSALDPLPAAPERRTTRRGWLRGYGLGILTRTPGGDISLAVGFPGTVDFEQAKLHVTLLESF